MSTPMPDPLRGFKQLNNGDVQLTMSRDDYDALLMQLGYAAGAAGRNDDPVFHRNNILLLNRLNAGNPNYTMYRAPKENKP